MKKMLPVFLCLLISFASCDKDRINENFQDDASITNINGKWKVVSYEDYEKASIIVKTDVDSWNGMDVILTFSNDSLWGYCTSNKMTGTYSLYGREIHILSYGGTKMGQPEWGNMFLKAVYDLQSFEINEHQLRFYYDDREKSVTFRRD